MLESVSKMDSRRESLLQFLSSIEEEEVINKEKKSENSFTSLPPNIPPVNPQVR